LTGATALALRAHEDDLFVAHEQVSTRFLERNPLVSVSTLAIQEELELLIDGMSLLDRNRVVLPIDQRDFEIHRLPPQLLPVRASHLEQRFDHRCTLHRSWNGPLPSERGQPTADRASLLAARGLLRSLGLRRRLLLVLRRRLRTLLPGHLVLLSGVPPRLLTLSKRPLTLLGDQLIVFQARKNSSSRASHRQPILL